MTTTMTLMTMVKIKLPRSTRTKAFSVSTADVWNSALL